MFTAVLSVTMKCVIFVLNIQLVVLNVCLVVS